MDDKKWEKAVESTEIIVFGFGALQEERKRRKKNQQDRYYMWKERVGFGKALFCTVGEAFLFEIIYWIFNLCAGVMSIRLIWLGNKREKEKMAAMAEDCKGGRD